MTSHLEPTNLRTENKNGVQDCFDFIKIHATNGVVLNGLLQWADIERKTTAENIWKTQAISKFDKDEISEAKIELWRICGESTLGKLVKRQGSGKSKSELDDICIALKKLSENDSLPMFLGRNFLVSKTAIFNTDANNSENVALTNRLYTLEESMNSFMTFSSDRTVMTSTNNTLSSKSAITKVGDTILKKRNGQKLRIWMTVSGLLSLRAEIKTAKNDKYHNKTLMRRKLKHGDKT